jgi:hypothetical protein
MKYEILGMENSSAFELTNFRAKIILKRDQREQVVSRWASLQTILAIVSNKKSVM